MIRLRVDLRVQSRETRTSFPGISRHEIISRFSKFLVIHKFEKKIFNNVQRKSIGVFIELATSLGNCEISY